MKNKLGDLNDHLFAQLERLGEKKMTAEEIEQEVARTNAIVAVADQVVSNANLKLRAAQLFAKHGSVVVPHLPIIGGDSE